MLEKGRTRKNQRELKITSDLRVGGSNPSRRARKLTGARHQDVFLF